MYHNLDAPIDPAASSTICPSLTINQLSYLSSLVYYQYSTAASTYSHVDFVKHRPGRTSKVNARESREQGSCMLGHDRGISATSPGASLIAGWLLAAPSGCAMGNGGPAPSPLVGPGKGEVDALPPYRVESRNGKMMDACM
ncbi:MAG: hypothetical protein Q9177_001977 [Variospora cf. flavescens]